MRNVIKGLFNAAVEAYREVSPSFAAPIGAHPDPTYDHQPPNFLEVDGVRAKAAKLAKFAAADIEVIEAGEKEFLRLSHVEKQFFPDGVRVEFDAQSAFAKKLLTSGKPEDSEAFRRTDFYSLDEMAEEFREKRRIIAEAIREVSDRCRPAAHRIMTEIQKQSGILAAQLEKAERATAKEFGQEFRPSAALQAASQAANDPRLLRAQIGVDGIATRPARMVLGSGLDVCKGLEREQEEQAKADALAAQNAVREAARRAEDDARQRRESQEAHEAARKIEIERVSAQTLAIREWQTLRDAAKDKGESIPPFKEWLATRK